MATRIINPVLSGFYPDPSMCVAEDTYYLVCSSFAYFPGLPIFKSKNGYKWEQIGNIIDRAEQLDFEGAGVSRGLFAPTIRYHKGKFYCICTQVDKLGNFIVTADKPEGPWSNPIPIPKAEGIDPSLFFDDDGTVWYIGTRPAPEGPKYNGNWEIWIQKINVETGELYGESKGIWRGALRDCVWPEGPHIYKINDYYYLIHAEGGTGSDHAVCVARCKTIDGEWVGKPANPILTHRHLGKNAGVINVGHADLVCTPEGKWWMCCLASRPYGEGEKRFCNLGRETFFVPVKWEDDWPVASWETGLVEEAYSLSGHVVKRSLEDAPLYTVPPIDDFNTPKLEHYWIGLWGRDSKKINCTENPGNLRIYGGKNFMQNMVLRRQTGFSFEACTSLVANFKNENDTTGLILFQNEQFNFRMQIAKKGRVFVLQLIKMAGPKEEILKEEILSGGNENIHMVLRVLGEKQKLSFEYGQDERNMQLFMDNIDSSILSTEKAGGFVGTVMGVFAASENAPKKSTAEDSFYVDFDWFKYENIGLDWICPV